MLLDPRRRWECPSCRRQLETTKPASQTPLHPCPAQAGLMVPFAPVTSTELDRSAVRHLPVERGDYLGGELAGPVMAMRTERADGSNDVHVYAPTATAQQE